jgi:serpin B
MTTIPITQARLYIQAVLHEAFIAVDEGGTEAAAATAVVVGVAPAR